MKTGFKLIGLVLFLIFSFSCKKDLILGDLPSIGAQSIKKVGVNSASIECSINPNNQNTNVLCEWGTTTSYGNSVSANQNPLTGSDPENVVFDITGLESEVTYYFRIKAINDVGVCYGDNMDFKTYAVVDEDGNGYFSVTIGNQKWLLENLRTTKYNDGSDIPNVTSFNEWFALTTGAYCTYNNSTDSAFIHTYGRLYNSYAVSTGKLAPEGWHVPTESDWTILSDYLGGYMVAGAHLKETGTTHWISPNEKATNESGFTALPGGRLDKGPVGQYNFQGLTGSAYFWSATIVGNGVKTFSVISNSYIFSSFAINKEYGYSIRLIKD